jgi:hypothetical protein
MGGCVVVFVLVGGGTSGIVIVDGTLMVVPFCCFAIATVTVLNTIYVIEVVEVVVVGEVHQRIRRFKVCGYKKKDHYAS